MCFLRRFSFARGQKTKHRFIYTSRSNTLPPVLLFCFYCQFGLCLLFFPFGYPNALTYYCCLLAVQALGEEGGRYGEYVDVAFAQDLSLVGLILLEMKHAAIDSPLLLLNGEVCWVKWVRGGKDGWSGARVDYVLRKNFLIFELFIF